MSDPFRNFDQWLTTDRMGEARERDAERFDALWEVAAEQHDVPYEANEEGHEDHAIYQAFVAFAEAADARLARLEAEAEAADAEAEQKYRDEMVGKPCGCPEGGVMVRRFGGYIVCTECGRDA